MQRTVIISENSFFKHALSVELSSHNFDLVGRFDRIEAFLAKQIVSSDLVILECASPDAAFWDRLQKLHHRSPCTASLLVTAKVDFSVLSKLFDAGGRGCLPTNVPIAPLPAYLKLLVSGQRVLPDGIADLVRTLVQATAPTADAEALQRALSSRERLILDALMRGCQNKQIAHQLALPLTTVKGDIKSIMRKTGASNRTALAIAAVKAGWTGPTVAKMVS